MKTFTSLELFAGCGGLALGLEMSGFTTIGLVEIDRSAAETLKTNRPNWNVICADIRDIASHNLEELFSIKKGELDLLSGGPPCQSFSTIGKRLGFADSRGQLFTYYTEFLRQLAPKMLIFENVKGLRGHDNGHTYATILEAFDAAGYVTNYEVLDAWDYGVPQRRQRLFTVGIRKDIHEICEFEFPKPHEYKPLLKDIKLDTDPGVEECARYSQNKQKVMELIPPGGCWKDLPEDIAKEYMKQCWYMPGGKTGILRRFKLDEPSFTIMTAPSSKQADRCHPFEIRPFSYRENARIQTFPDDWVFCGSLSSKYRQIGNAVPVALAKDMGTKAYELLDQYYSTIRGEDVVATRGEKKNNYEASEAFLQYEEEIVTNPAYAGMPDLRHDDGTIQWEAPSNRASGAFQFSHDKRYQWWVEKAGEIGISTEEDKWISKVAKTIHPTKQHPCKVCGRVMDIRYCYLSSNFMKRVQKLIFYDGTVEMNEVTHIIDFLAAFVDTYGNRAFAALPGLLKCTQVKEFPKLGNDLSAWTKWIEEEYIPKEPSMLGPGAMSNAPDRLDGFHTFNRCCRSSADKGRSKENLASYSTDRRAFENWSDGNWITANKLMGFINSNPDMKKEYCANEGSEGHHPRPCSADHIGPISLGFCHRPEFQFLCKSCNSAKNNRMYYSDVIHLIEAENGGETVVTWYANPIWQKCKSKVTDRESALRLSRVMRDNRNIAMMLLAEFIRKNEYLFLLTLLNLGYADYEYDIIPESVAIKNQIVTVEFARKSSSLRYVSIQKTRKIRVAFSSLDEYSRKENRNGYVFSNAEIESLKMQAFSMLAKVNNALKVKNQKLVSILSNDDNADTEIERFISSVNYTELVNTEEFIKAKEFLVRIMQIVADELSSNWDDPRYSREVVDD